MNALAKTPLKKNEKSGSSKDKCDEAVAAALKMFA